LTRRLPAGKIEVIDVGGGSGYLRDLLADCGYFGSYTCLDIVKDERLDQSNAGIFRTDFIHSSIETLDLKGLGGLFDLVVTNSVLEHISDDRLAVFKCGAMVKENGLQIHIVPAPAGLFLFLFHGYRQYNKKRLRDLLLEDSSCEFVALGGFGSFLCHLLVVTLCEVVLKMPLRSKKSYSKLASLAISLDRIFSYPASMFAIIRAESSKSKSLLS
jgi:2-polyprenyl-3-methyl-5-hydroxy-6-metoxy-1,4-benzoquinol methylase